MRQCLDGIFLQFFLIIRGGDPFFDPRKRFSLFSNHQGNAIRIQHAIFIVFIILNILAEIADPGNQPQDSQ